MQFKAFIGPYVSQSGSRVPDFFSLFFGPTVEAFFKGPPVTLSNRKCSNGPNSSTRTQWPIPISLNSTFIHRSATQKFYLTLTL